MSLKPKAKKSTTKKKKATKRKVKPIVGVTPTGKIKVTMEGVVYERDYELKDARSDKPWLKPVKIEEVEKGYDEHITRYSIGTSGEVATITDGIGGKMIKKGNPKGEAWYQRVNRWSHRRVSFVQATEDGNMSTSSWLIDQKGNMRIDTVNLKETDVVSIDEFRTACSWANTWGRGSVKRVISPRVRGIKRSVPNYDLWEQAHQQREEAKRDDW